MVTRRVPGELPRAQRPRFARGLDVSPPTVARYADVLVGTFLLRRLEPLHANLGKRLVKSPKLYLRDSGLLHALLVVQDVAGTREGFEMKLGTDPQPPRGFWNAVDDLTLDSVTVLHAGEGRWPLREGVEARALVSLASA